MSKISKLLTSFNIILFVLTNVSDNTLIVLLVISLSTSASARGNIYAKPTFKIINKNNPENIIDTGFVINNFIKSAEGSKLLWSNE